MLNYAKSNEEMWSFTLENSIVEEYTVWKDAHSIQSEKIGYEMICTVCIIFSTFICMHMHIGHMLTLTHIQKDQIV